MAKNESKKCVIYILTNADYPENCVKIGFTKDLEGRLGNLNTASIHDFEVFATYEVPDIKKHKPDQLLHNLMVALNPSIKPNPKKEFFTLYPEEAFDILENIALMHNRRECLILKGTYDSKHSLKKKKVKVEAKPQAVKGNKYSFAEATLVSTGDGKYYLGKDSILKEWNGNPDNLKFKRQQDDLIASGSVKIINKKMVTQIDLPFKSPSGAINLVLCYPENGWRKWKNKDGKTIDEIERNK